MVTVMKTATRTTPDIKSSTALLSLLLALTLAVCASPASADRDIPWDSLSKGERSVLRKHHRDWSGLGPNEQQRLRKGARQYLELPPNKRKAVERKHSQYEKMSPKERERLRKKYSKQKKDR